MHAISRGRWKAPIHSGSSGTDAIRSRATASPATAAEAAGRRLHASKSGNHHHQQQQQQLKWGHAHQGEPRVSISLFVDLDARGERLKALGGLKRAALQSVRRLQEAAITEYFRATPEAREEKGFGRIVDMWTDPETLRRAGADK